MTFCPDRPWNDLPPLPPAAELETHAVLKACIDARTVLAELKIAGRLIPNQTVLINSIPTLEAQASSEIENIVTTADRLFRFAGAAELRADPATREALRYRTALHEGYRSLARKPISTATAVQVCRTILGVEIDVRATPGTALVNDKTGAIVYTPPEGADRLRALLANWERYLHERDGIDPLIRMAVQHYQFEAIHPFTDGNGRTGRVLNLLFLIEQGLLDVPVLYLSRHINRNRAEYYRLLLATSADAAWHDWILFVLEAVQQTAQWTVLKLTEIRELLDRTADDIRRGAPKIYSRELTELIFVQPYCRISDVVAAGIAKRQSAAVYLRKLRDIGILREVEAGRERLFVNPRLMNALADAPRGRQRSNVADPHSTA